MSNEDARSRILAKTRELLDQQAEGDSITVAKVAAATHVSRATLYRYFPNKETLLRAAGASDEHVAIPATPRARILEAALEVFGERGFHAAAMSEIANRAGLSLSGLHWHYKNKDQLVADMVQYIPILPTIADALAQVEREEADLETQLTQIAAVALELFERRSGLLRFMLLEAEVYPDVARLASTHTIGRALPLLTRFFEQHARAGRLRPGSAQARAQAFVGMFVSLALLRPAFAPLLAPDMHETAREYIAIMLHGILSETKKG